MTTEAIILLAGQGTRLRPLTDNAHKALIDVGGKSILERQLHQLARLGITKAHLILGYRADEVRNFAHTVAPNELTLSFAENARYTQTNTGASLLIALEEVRSDFLLMDGDVVMEDALLAQVLEPSDDCLLLCDMDRSKLDVEAVRFSVTLSGKINALSKHVPMSDSIGESIGIGLYKAAWREPLMQCLKASLNDSAKHNWYYEDALNAILSEQPNAFAPLKPIPTGSFHWVEIDDHKDLARAKEMFGN